MMRLKPVHFAYQYTWRILKAVWGLCGKNRPKSAKVWKISKNVEFCILVFSGNNRMSRISACLEAARHFQLSEKEAAEIVEHQISAIGENWSAVCDEADFTDTDRAMLWGRQYLNSFAFYDLESKFAELAKIATDVRIAKRG